MAYQVYATKADLASYLGVEEASLPADAQRLLQRASEQVKQTTRDNIDTTNTDHMEAAKLATCAQVEYWITDGETVAISAALKSYSLEGISMTFADTDNRKGLSSRSRGYLNEEGLLYAGIRVGGREAIEK